MKFTLRLLANSLTCIAAMFAVAGTHADTLLQMIARQRGLIQSGGRLNLQKAAEAVLNDFRSGTLGRLTLETPEQHAAWVAAGEALEAQRLAKKQKVRTPQRQAQSLGRNHAQAQQRHARCARPRRSHAQFIQRLRSRYVVGLGRPCRHAC